MDFEGRKVKKRNLSLLTNKATTKSPKICDENKLASNIIDISSDEEDIWQNPQINKETKDLNLSQGSTDSDCTIIYSPNSDCLNSLPTPRKPLISVAQKSPFCPNVKNESEDNDSIKAQETLECTQVSIKSETFTQSPIKFETPNKSHQASTSYVSSTQRNVTSPSTKEKYFSPGRKRSVTKKTPSKVKRSLNNELSRSLPSRILFEDDLYAVACEGMDDKTKFLLNIINKYLNTPSLQHLLDLESHCLLNNCLQVVKPGMRLVCRLFWMKDCWYKQHQVVKICSDNAETSSVTNFEEMIESLVEKRLIDLGTNENMTFDEYTAVLKRDELKEICKELKIQKNSKQDAIEALRNFSRRTSNISNFFSGPKSSNSSRVLDFMRCKAGPCYKLSERARSTLHKLYLLMYLGMDYNIIREKKLELLLLYDKIQRETYPIDKTMALDNASVVFRTRDEFECYITAHNIYEDFLLRTSVPEKCAIVKQVYELYKNINHIQMASYTAQPQWLHRYTPPNIYIKILEAGLQELKKEKSTENYYLSLNILSDLIAQTSFRQHRKAEWYAEKALILHTYLNEHDKAAEILLEGFKSNLSEELKDGMRARARKIANQKNAAVSDHLKRELSEFAHKDNILEKNIPCKHVYKQPMDRSSARGKVKFETRTAEGRMVQEAEEFCIAHYLYTKEFTDGEHWEGRIVTTLFFLLFWDVIYSKPAGVPGVFLSHYQLYPLDLFTDSFYHNRKEAIDRLLVDIEESSEDQLIETMHETWNRRPTYELSGLSRGVVSWENARAVAACLGPKKLSTICRRLATDYRYSHSGFPDLTLWHAHTKRIMFVEVKTDSDKPSTKQLQWLQYLRQHDIEAEFCYVGANTSRQKQRQRTLTKSPVKAEE